MSGILVVPFVGMLESLPAFVVSEREIEEVLTFTRGAAGGGGAAVEVAREPGRVWHGFAYELDGYMIWGATGWMLHSLLEIVRKEASWLIPA